MADAPKPATKRRFHLKSRNGCLTCKRRRIKCDEHKPTCMKCQHLGLVCGYTLGEDTPRPPAVTPPSPPRARGDPEDLAKRRRLSEAPPSPSALDLTLSGDMHPTPLITPVRDHLPPPPPPPQAPQAPPKAPFDPALLNAGNLNNISLSHLVNNLGDTGSLGSLASLLSLASLANLPIDLSNIGLLLGASGVGGAALGAKVRQLQAQLRAAPPPEAPSVSPNIKTPDMGPSLLQDLTNLALNMLDLRLMYHYTTQVSSTITGAGILETNIWTYDVPMMAFSYPFLMHSILAFSATHLLRTEKGLDQCVTCHRGDALRLLREEVLNINADNTDALVASALILIMDLLANALFPSLTLPKSLPALAWIFHVKGAATILTAVWPLTELSRFYKFILVDLSDLGDIMNQKVDLKDLLNKIYADLECHDLDIADLFPVEVASPYLITLAYLNKLHKERYKTDFLLRIFLFPALLDKSFLSLLMTGDIKAMRIMRLYYKLLRLFTTEMKDKVWFLEGVLNVLPVDVEEYAGGAGGMHMMLDFLGGGPAIIDSDLDDEMAKFDPTGTLTRGLIDPNNLPSDITSNLDVMGDSGFIGEEP